MLNKQEMKLYYASWRQKINHYIESMKSCQIDFSLDDLIKDVFVDFCDDNELKYQVMQEIRRSDKVLAMFAEKFDCELDDIFPYDLDYAFASNREFVVILGDVDWTTFPFEKISKTKFISGNSTFHYSKVTDLGTLQVVCGDVDLRDFKGKSTGNLEYVGGNFDSRDSSLEDCGKMKAIGGTAYFAKKFKDSKALESVRRLKFEYSPLTTLGSIKNIKTYAYIANSNITSLGELTFCRGLDLNEQQIELFADRIQKNEDKGLYELKN